MATSEIRRHKVRQFVTVPKDLAREKGKFEKEIGIYARILALPECKSNGEGFDFSVEGYCKYYECSPDAIYTGLDSLVKRGWIDRIRERNEKGQYSKVIYDLLPDKAESPHTDEPQKENPHREKPNVEKPNRENREQKKNLIKEDLKKGRGNRQAVSSHTHTRADSDDFEIRRFCDLWNKIGESYDSKTPFITVITKKRSKLISHILRLYKGQEQCISQGIRHAMTSKRAQGLNKGMIAPADINYMLEHFTELVEGSF